MLRSLLPVVLLASTALAGPLRYDTQGQDVPPTMTIDGVLVAVGHPQSENIPIPFNANASKTIDVDVEGEDDEEETDQLNKRDPVATSFRQALLYHHNYHRANHSAPDLVWSTPLANTARKIGKTCVYAHNMDTDGGNYGQNIAVGLPSTGISTIVSDMFYNNEMPQYGDQYGREPDTSQYEKWGHFTQVIWKGTTHVGCAVVDCRKHGLQNWPYPNAYFTVCNYRPEGNFIGRFAQNIGAPLGHATITGSHNIDANAIASHPWPGKFVNP